jgi:hypothetical protein
VTPQGHSGTSERWSGTLERLGTPWRHLMSDPSEVRGSILEAPSLIFKGPRIFFPEKVGHLSGEPWQPLVVQKSGTTKDI